MLSLLHGIISRLSPCPDVCAVPALQRAHASESHDEREALSVWTACLLNAC